jgi:hypothetical protein
MEEPALPTGAGRAQRHRYEGLTREQVLDVLKHAERSLTPRVT